MRSAERESRGMENEEDNHTEKIWEWILRIMVPISIAYFGWTTSQIFEVEKRLSIIENNRYTPKDALQFERAMNARFDVVGTRLTTSERLLETNNSLMQQLLAETRKLNAKTN